MLRLITQNPTPSTLLTAALALLVVNCSATGDPVTGSFGGNGNSSSGGNSSANGGSSYGGGAVFGGAPGSGGSSTGSGGSSTGSGGASKGGSTGNGGSSTGNGGSTATGSGGATTTGNGGAATTGSGGASTASCATYDGTLKADSTIFMDGYGMSGTWQGYAYTYTYGTGAAAPTFKPGSSTTMSCFPGKTVCANGSIPASDDSGGGLGWSIGQPKGGTAAGVAVSGKIKFQAKGVVVGMRLGLTPGDYCYTLTADDVTAINGTGLTIDASKFATKCWGTTGTAFAGGMVEGVQIAIPGSAAAAKTFDYCIIAIGPG